MHRSARIGVGLFVACACLADSALADEPAAVPSTWVTPRPPPSTPPAEAPSPNRGVAVLALPGSRAASWPLAQAVYADESLRPPFLDDARARVLAGEAPPANASPELHDLWETCAAMKGDDAPSRLLLGSLGRSLHLEAIAVVRQDPHGATLARVYSVRTGTFEATEFVRGEGMTWAGAVEAIHKLYGRPLRVESPTATSPSSPQLGQAPARDAQNPGNEGSQGSHHAFYESPWFWGALGAAALAAAGVYFATQDNTPSTIHLQVQVPR